jgi:hypothetical protein
MQLSERELHGLEALYKGEIAAVGPYLRQAAFDGHALPLLRDVKAACGPNKLYGRFRSREGNATFVAVSLRRRLAGSASQEWVVVEITREINTAVNIEQAVSAQQELRTRYARWDTPPDAVPKPGTGVFTAYFMNRPMFTLALQEAPDYAPYQDRACGDGFAGSID